MDIVLFFVGDIFARTAKVKSLFHSLNRRHKPCFQFIRKLNILDRTIETGELLHRHPTKKVFAVKSNEPWVDAGQFNSMYDVSLKIASGEFEFEPFEMEHAFNSVNLETGLVATSPQLKEAVEQNYDINGHFMAVDKMHNVTTKNTIDLCVQNGSLIVDNG